MTIIRSVLNKQVAKDYGALSGLDIGFILASVVMITYNLNL
jgi:tetrahydromethanopterin S-methyltransferase subunit G